MLWVISSLDKWGQLRNTLRMVLQPQNVMMIGVYSTSHTSYAVFNIKKYQIVYSATRSDCQWKERVDIWLTFWVGFLLASHMILCLNEEIILWLISGVIHRHIAFINTTTPKYYKWTVKAVIVNIVDNESKYRLHKLLLMELGHV